MNKTFTPFGEVDEALLPFVCQFAGFRYDSLNGDYVIECQPKSVEFRTKRELQNIVVRGQGKDRYYLVPAQYEAAKEVMRLTDDLLHVITGKSQGVNVVLSVIQNKGGAVDGRSISRNSIEKFIEIGEKMKRDMLLSRFSSSEGAPDDFNV